MPKRQPKEPTTSLLDSVFYQSALRSNRLEDNRLKEMQVRIKTDFQRQYMRYDNHSRSSYDWAIEMRKNSGYAFSVHPSRLKAKTSRPQTVPEQRPACCVLYGMIIGERPVLLKNFLGRKAKKKRPKSPEGATNDAILKSAAGENLEGIRLTDDGRAKTTLTHRPILSRESNDERPAPIAMSASSRDSRTGETYKTFMYDNKLVTQVPVGYSRSSVRPRTCFTEHTSEMLRPENAKIPGYYTLRYKYVLPPVRIMR